MSDKKKNFELEELFKGINGIVNAKTVVAEPTKIEDTIIVPLVDISCGMGFGEFSTDKSLKNAAGLSTKLSPSAVLIIQNGVTKLVNVKTQDAITKVLDIVPDIISKFSSKESISDEVLDLAKSKLEEK